MPLTDTVWPLVLRLLSVGCLPEVLANGSCRSNCSATTVEITDGTATGIDTIDADSHDRKLYDIQGRKLEQTQGHGIYIVNGKKMICK